MATPLPEPRALLLSLFRAAVDAADPARVVPLHLPPRPRGRTVVVGAGKAAAAMAAAVDAAWDGPLAGTVVTRDGHGRDAGRIEVIEAEHPVPGPRGRAAAARIGALADGLGADDMVLCLLSGGGSALLVAPPDAVPLADKQAVSRALLACGASIDEINAVRKHLSTIKGGRLAARAAPARVVTLAISDVPGDDPAVIASGPTVPDPSTRFDAMAVLAKYGIDPPASVAARLADPACESPKPGDPAFARADLRMVATPWASLEAAAAVAAACGVTPLILSDRIEGEAREVGKAMAGLALSAAAHGRPAAPPCVLLSGGETTVTVRGKGRGGRNAEFLLGLTQALAGAPGIWSIACDTDGIDGSEDNAGALAGPDSLARAAAAGVSAAACLAANDAWGFFSTVGDLVVTGPTRTNVNDFRAILVTRGEG